MAEVVKLRADPSGFLVGDRLGDAAVSTLGAIKADTAAMLALMRNGGAPSQSLVQRLPAAARPAPFTSTATARRGAGPAPVAGGLVQPEQPGLNPSQAARAARVTAERTAEVAAAMRRVATVSEANRRAQSVRAATQTRGSDGRFGSGPKGEGGGLGAAGGALGAAASRVAGAVDGSEKLDPTLEAGAELLGGLKRAAGVVAPAGRTLLGMFRRGAKDKAAEEEKKQTGWLTRIWRTMRDSRRDAARVKAPKAPAAAGGGGILSGLLGALPGGGMLAGLAGMLGRGAGVVGGGLAALARGALRRIPLIGALFEGFAAFGRESEIDADPNLSPEERQRRKVESRGQGFGAILGTLGGGLLGAIGGPLGIALGAAFGGWLGGEGGKMLAQPFVDAAQWFSRKWETVTGIWEAVTKKAREGFDLVADVFKSIEASLDNLPVIGPARRAIRAAASYAGEKVSEGAAWVGERATAAGAAVGAAARQTWEQARAGVGSVISRVLGTDKGVNVTERADGSVVERSGARNWRNNNPGNIEYGDFAKRMGAIGSDGRFAIFPDYETGRKAKEGLIFDGANYRNLSLKDAISRYAPPSENDTGAYQATVLAAVGGANKRMADYTPAERTAIMDAMQRVEGFKPGTERVLRAATAVANPLGLPMPSLPTAPRPATAAPAPSIDADMGRITSESPAPAPAAPIVPTQDVPDRTIAHIATGGIGGSLAHR